MRDGWSIVDTCKELEKRGADVVGLNCFRGPQTMLTYIEEVPAAKCHVAALLVPFRTTRAFYNKKLNLPDNNGCVYLHMAELFLQH